MKKNTSSTHWIRLIYLYLFACIGLIIMVTGCIRGINIVLTRTVFKQASVYPRPPVLKGQDEQVFEAEQIRYQLEESQRQFHYEVAGALSMLLVGIPLYWYHWNLIKKEQH